MDRFKWRERRAGGKGEVFLSIWGEVGEAQGQDVRHSP